MDTKPLIAIARPLVLLAWETYMDFVGDCRDPDDRWVGGVLSGVAAYFGFDPLILRLIYLMFLFLAMIVDLGSASFNIKRTGITNLQVAGETEYAFDLRFAARNDEPAGNGFSMHALDIGLDHQRTVGVIKKGWLIDVSRQVQANANLYARQYAQCEDELSRNWFMRLLF